VSVDAPRPSWIWRAVLGVAIFVFVFFYRFNTLGGALGGFDDDHFVPMAYAKQVQAGEQPLRDFTGLGLQGAWPSLTFELSAAAQSLLGNNLRSEALLAVSGLAAASVLTFLAGTYVAALPVAFATAIFATLLATRLYNFPKVLVLGAAVLMLAWYVRSPTRRSAVALGVLTVVAFLFRHDYAVYVGAGILAVVALAAGQVSTAVKHLGVCALVVGLLLVPSAVFVQRHGGLIAYVQDSIVAVEQESGRTERIDLGFVSRGEGGRQLTVVDFLSEEQNAVQWLYYAHLLLPMLVLGMSLWPRSSWSPVVRNALIVWAVMALVVAPLFLRGNTGARFGDMAPLTAVLLAGVCSRVFQRSGGTLLRVSRISIALLLLAGSVQSVWAVGGATHDLDESGWVHSPRYILNQAARRWTDLGALPDAYWTGEPESPSIGAVQYLHACTRASDRVLVISYQPELLPLADRRFAAGRASLIPGLLTDDDHQRRLVERWNRESVPLVLVEPAEEHVHEIPIVYKHLIDRYVDSGPMTINGEVVLHVYAERGRPVSGTFGPGAWPCFR
jgi:hypothetical protein